MLLFIHHPSLPPSLPPSLFPTLLIQASLLRRFLDHILDVKPNIIVTYNGDSFDWLANNNYYCLYMYMFVCNNNNWGEPERASRS